MIDNIGPEHPVTNLGQLLNVRLPPDFGVIDHIVDCEVGRDIKIDRKAPGANPAAAGIAAVIGLEQIVDHAVTLALHQSD